MYVSSAKYRDACESGKVIYSSFYRTLLFLNKIQLKKINLKDYFSENDINKIVICGCNDVTELFLALCDEYSVNPEFIIDGNPSRYKEAYKKYKVYNYEKIKDADDIDLVIIMSNYNFNEIAEKMHNYNVSYSNMISIEELLANIICCNN